MLTNMYPTCKKLTCDASHLGSKRRNRVTFFWLVENYTNFSYPTCGPLWQSHRWVSSEKKCNQSTLEHTRFAFLEEIDPSHVISIKFWRDCVTATPKFVKIVKFEPNKIYRHVATILRRYPLFVLTKNTIWTPPHSKRVKIVKFKLNEMYHQYYETYTDPFVCTYWKFSLVVVGSLCNVSPHAQLF